MEVAAKELESRGIPYEMKVLSAHRDPEAVREYSLAAESRGLKVIIAGAGKAAALPGVVASMTDLPVIGVPIRTADLGGLDSLLSMVQMPSGVPVADGGHQRRPQRGHPGRQDPSRGWPRRPRPATPAKAAGRSRPGRGRRPMIDRYSTPEMAAVWTDQARMAAWLRWNWPCAKPGPGSGEIPEEAMCDIREKAAFDVDRVNEIEETTQHDVIAFVSCVAENVGEASKYIHYGLTSSDVLDTGLALQLRAAGGLLAEETRRLGKILQRRALEHRDTVMIGRTHGVHAEPITFGMVLGLWAFEVQRGLERLERATQQVSVGKISGAVGSYANVDPRGRDR